MKQTIIIKNIFPQWILKFRQLLNKYDNETVILKFLEYSEKEERKFKNEN